MFINVCVYLKFYIEDITSPFELTLKSKIINTDDKNKY